MTTALTTRHSPRWFAVLVLSTVMLLVLLGRAALGDEARRPEVKMEAVDVLMGRSIPLRAPWPVKRVSITNPEIADVKVLTPNQVLLQGKGIGVTDLFLWSEDEELWQARVEVGIELPRIHSQLSDLFPQSQLRLTQSEDVMFISGSLGRAEQVIQLHRFMDALGIKYVDLSRVTGAQQVQVQVRVAEVSRGAVRALGVNMFYGEQNFFGGSVIGSSSGGPLNPISIGVPDGTPIASKVPFTFTDTLSVSPAVSLFGGFPRANLEIFLQALAENEYLRILAEPTLVALSGEEASFLAGGEFPIPIVQDANDSITIEFKEFGVRLHFRPLVLGDSVIRLRVSSEVSERSGVGAVTKQGIEVPTLITRRAETTLQMKSGQTFAMAGLIQETVNARKSRVPGLGDLPILGSLFRSVRYQKGETELLVLVTCTLVEPLSMAKGPSTPGLDHVTPDDWTLFVEGRIEGTRPAQISSQQADRIKQMGLHRLEGPGPWAQYGRHAVIVKHDSLSRYPRKDTTLAAGTAKKPAGAQ